MTGDKWVQFFLISLIISNVEQHDFSVDINWSAITTKNDQGGQLKSKGERKQKNSFVFTFYQVSRRRGRGLLIYWIFHLLK